MVNKEKLWSVIVRGISGKCPRCGKGKLLQSYLKQKEDCSSCGEKLGHITADDGPAWLTILLVGHILAPFFLSVLPHLDWSDQMIMTVAISLTLILTLLLLPPCKGVFIALIWRSGCVGSEK